MLAVEAVEKDFQVLERKPERAVFVTERTLRADLTDGLLKGARRVSKGGVRKMCSLRHLAAPFASEGANQNHCWPPVDMLIAACCAINASTSSASHTVTLAPSLKGFGNRPSRTQRHTVVGLTGSLPGLPLVDASSAMRITRCDTKHPLKVGRSTVCASMGRIVVDEARQRYVVKPLGGTV